MRHGETVWNHEHRFTTRTDVPLSEAGTAQAEEAAERLAETPIDRIYSSPLGRARFTAEAVARRQSRLPEIVVDERLTEIDAGPFEGQTEEELKAGPLAGEFERWHNDREPEFPEGTEPFADALRRAAGFLNDRAGDEGTTLVVTHGSLARLMVSSYFLGGPPALHRHLWLDNCRLAVVEWRGGVPKVTGFNLRQPEG
jgi:broad specificity phosphatase PhoE